MPKGDPRYKNITAVGAGAITKDQVRPEASLDNVGDFHYVTLANLLPFDFIGQVATTREVDAPVRIVNGAEKGVDENTLRAAGLDLRNPDHKGQQHVPIKIEIKAGQTINLPGAEAKVIIRQLVNEIMAYEGNTLRRGSPSYRKQVEDRVIQGVRSIDDLIGNNIPTKDQLVNEALKQENEKAFPTLDKDETDTGKN